MTAAPLLFQIGTVAVLVSIGARISAEFVVTGARAVSAGPSRLVGEFILGVSRRTVVADVEVLVSRIGAVGHGAAYLVGSIPDNLGVMSNHSPIGRPNSIFVVFYLIIPGLDGSRPAVLIARHVQVLPTAAGTDLPLA